MIRIPKQLQQEEFMFVKLGQWNRWRLGKTKKYEQFYPKTKEELVKLKDQGWTAQGKAPLDTDWQHTCNFSLWTPEIKNHYWNIGVLCGPGNLRVLDLDEPSQEIIDYFFNKIDTFTVLTGSGGYHFYIVSDYDTNHYLKKDGIDLGEFRAQGVQVVAPGSRHPLGTYYKVFKNKPIAKISPEQVKEILKPYIAATERQAQISKTNKIIIGDGWTQEMAQIVKVSSLSIKYFGRVCCPVCQTTKYRLNIDDSHGFWKCWGCGSGGNLIEFVKIAIKHKEAAT